MSNNLNIQPYALCSYPGNIVVLDDDRQFTSLISQTLASDFHVKLFNESQSAFSYFEKVGLLSQTSPFLTPLESRELDTDGVVYAIDYDRIITLLHNAARFDEPTVLLVDYHMPDMTGIEFLSKLNNKHIKKVLLTGVDEQSIAVDAFNQGLIDKFIVKSPNLDGTLVHELHELNAAYFCELTTRKLGEDIIAHVAQDNYLAVFQQWVKQHQLSEYYRIDDFGSVVGFTEHGDIVWLLIQPNDINSELIESYNQHHDSTLGSDKLIYLLSDNDKNGSPEQWGHVVFDSVGEFITEKELFSYAMVKNNYLAYDPSAIVSFSQSTT